MYDKIDGSTAILYFYANSWHVATTSVPDGSAMMCMKKPEKACTMKELFWKIFHLKKFVMPSSEDAHMCFIFEVTSPDHLIVVRYKEDGLVLHGARNLKTLKEVNP